MVVGKTIAKRYRLDRMIGHGGMGEIFAGTDLEENRIVAVKRLKRELTQLDSSVVQRFLREGQVQSQIKHPNVVQVVDVCQHEGEHFLVMEYVGGGTLGELMRRQGRLPIVQSLEIAYQVAQALEESHSYNIVHRDLKPANILMMPNGTPKLTDFGAARIDSAHKLTVTGMVIGTYSYMSPESCKGEAVDARADVWSFGILLFEMLTGQRPFGQDNPMQLMLAIMREPPADIQKLNPEISDHLADLVYRMLAKDRDQRIPTMKIVATEISVMLEQGLSLSRMHSTMNTAFFDASSQISSPRASQLPSYGALIGRESETKELVNLFNQAEARLITLLGPGGVGKTHLAVHVAKAVEAQFPDGIFFVDFTDVKDTQLIASTIASELRFQFFGPEDPVQQLSNYLSNKRILLILDNFEQLIKASSMLLNLLNNAPLLNIVLTTRERLNLREEFLVTIDGLATSLDLDDEKAGQSDARKAHETEAYQLFIQKARKIRSDFAPGKKDQAAIGKICQLVDGSPLAIELAAGWVNMLMPEEILEEMAEGMDFLETNMHDVPERHRSIRAVSENSWRYLDDTERETLRRLSVFHGGYRREAIRHVIGASLRTLNSLIDKALLRRSPKTGLYSMQEMLRWFAAEKLNEVPEEKRETEWKHAEYYLGRIKQLFPDLIGGGQLDALASIDRRLPNIQIALESAINQKNVELIEVWVDSMYYFYLMRGRQREGAEAIRKATFGVSRVLPSNDHLLQVKMMSRLGAYQRFIGEIDSAQAVLKESLNLARSMNYKKEISFSLYQLGATRPEIKSSANMWREAFEIAEEINDGVLIAETTNWLAFNCFESGDIQKAIKWLERGLSERRKLNDSYGLAIILTNLGFIHMRMGIFGKAKRFLREALEINKKLRNYNGIATDYNNLSYIALHTGELSAASNAAKQAVQYFERVGNKRGRGESLGNLIDIALKQNNLDEAERICQDCISLYQSINLPVLDFIGRLGMIALERGDYRSGYQQLVEVLSEDNPRTALKLEMLTGFARIFAKQGKIAQAFSLLRLVTDHNATEQVVKERAEGYLAEIKDKQPDKMSVETNADQPQSVDEWVAYVLQMPVPTLEKAA
ncbi:MAG: protein kinase [Chloroflexota bacterium]